MLEKYPTTRSSRSVRTACIYLNADEPFPHVSLTRIVENGDETYSLIVQVDRQTAIRLDPIPYELRVEMLAVLCGADADALVDFLHNRTELFGPCGIS